ncbi:hypothetical protein QQS21_008062 [Conoideocrella luteorostrata]|uniref:Uncharacterized protein n=1 Tax=Conoideocrella luteorostrata TaxID=1105319 RepID=A0AAJ0CJW4_9HYPO|nr:hypothetical protein QQS21_008062 [Conoideocrella luteorostrata]
MLFSKQRSKPDAFQNGAPSVTGTVSWKLWNNRSQQPSNNGHSEHVNGLRASNRRWFSTFRLKPQAYKDKSDDLSGAGSLDIHNDIDFMHKPRRPMMVNHRRSLSSVFKTVKARYSRDRLDKFDKNGIEHQSPDPPQLIETPEELTLDEVTFTTAEPRQDSPPPRLEMPSDLAICNAATGKSTFRACLEKAVADIDNKYGTSSSTCLTQNLEDTGASRLTSFNALPFHVRGTFRPRYQLPIFVDAPAPKAKSTAGELRELSPPLPAETVPLGTTSARIPNNGNEGGYHLPALLLDEALAPTFNIGEFMPPQTPPKKHTEPDKDVIAKNRSEPSASSNNSTHTVVRDVDDEPLIEISSNPNNKPCQPTPPPTMLTSSTAVISHEANSPHPAQKMSVRNGPQNRSNSERRTGSPSRSNFKMSDREGLLSDMGTELKLVRARSIPSSSECSMFHYRQTSQSSHASAPQEEHVASVSELVSKFRGMGSVPGVYPAHSPMELPIQRLATRRASRGKQLETIEVVSQMT